MATIKGDNYSQDIDGTNGDDDIYGLGGSDDLFGFGGDDDLFGGSGDDNLWGGTGSNDLWGGSGDDDFIVSARNSGVSSKNYIGDFDSDDDKIDVSNWGVSDFTQIDMLLGNTDDDNATFNARYGGRSNIVEIGEVEADELQSNDFIFSKAGASEISGTRSDDTLFGSRSADLIEGGSGRDQLLGGYGNDRIYGDSGDDRIYGGRGQDTMSGNSGRDVFVFAFANETSASSSRDRITDFDLGTDTIDVSLIDAVSSSSRNNEFDWIGRDGFSREGQLRYSYDDGRTIISGNTDRDSSAEFQIALNGRKQLVDDDFNL